MLQAWNKMATDIFDKSVNEAASRRHAQVAQKIMQEIEDLARI
jgi:hypothetical protein